MATWGRREEGIFRQRERDELLCTPLPFTQPEGEREREREK